VAGAAAEAEKAAGFLDAMEATFAGHTR